MEKSMWGRIFEGVGLALTVVGAGITLTGSAPLVGVGIAVYGVWVGVAGISCTYSSHCS